MENPRCKRKHLLTLSTAYTCGGIVSGMLITPTLSKRFGRKPCMQLGCLIVIAFTFLQVFAKNMPSFIAGRLLMGIGQGIALPNGPTYISEIAPAAVRGKILSFWQVWYTIGAFIVYWTAYGCKTTKIDMGLWQWRTPILLQVFLPACVVGGLFFCPESPRWLVEKGRIDEARHCLELTRDPDEVEIELESIIAAVDYERAEIDFNQSWYAPYITLFKDPSLRRRMFVALYINAGQQLSGNTTLSSYTTLIYQKVFNNSDTSFLINALSASFAIPFTLNATWLVDRIGRKPILLIGGTGQALSLLIIAIIGIATPTLDDNGTRPYAVGIAIALMMFVFILFYKPSWGATVWIYTADIFSTSVRVHAIGINSQVQNVVSTILNQFFPTFMNNCGFYTFFFFFGTNAVLTIGVWFILPETKGVALEDIDELFGGVSHRKGGEELHDREIGKPHSEHHEDRKEAI